MLAFELKGKVVGQMSALVVAAKQPQGIGVVNLERPEVENAFDGKVSTVDVIAEEKIASFGGIATDLEELHQIVILAVDITTDGNGCIHLEQVGLCAQDIGTGLEDEESLLLGQAAFAVKVLLEEVDVWLGARAVGVELLVCGFGGSGCLNICGRGSLASRYYDMG